MKDQTAEQFLIDKSDIGMLLHPTLDHVTLYDARQYAILYAIEQLEDLQKIFAMHDQNAASIENTFNDKITILKSKLSA